MTTNPMIETHGLTKAFTARKQTVEAVRGLDLTVAEGELVALLGPNGAGKSTTLRMLTTLIAPTSGTARVAGYDVTTQPQQVRRAIGYIGQGNGAGHNQRGRDELVSHGLAYGMTRSAARARAEELVASLDLGQVADRKVSSLSGGQRRRLDIAMGLIHAPALLFLDEPSTGLDPQNRANLQEHIVALRERLKQDGGTLSGGEQQMLAIARALMARPRILMLDEPSMGLAPVLVETIFRTILEINREGTTILLVEQNASMALQVASRGYILQSGVVAMQATAKELRESDMVRRTYLGIE